MCTTEINTYFQGKSNQGGGGIELVRGRDVPSKVDKGHIHEV